jgi:RNA polymerase sigma factor (sigma-70 family)
MFGMTTNLEKKLLKQVVANKSESALKELLRAHESMFHSISNRILGSCPVEHQDFLDSKLLLLYEAAISFDPAKKAKFSTWLYNCIRFKCLNIIKNFDKKIDISDQDLKSLLDSKLQLEHNAQAEHAEILHSIRDVLDAFSDEKAKKVIELRYFSGSAKILNYVEIAKLLKVTPQTALNWHNKFINFAKKKLTKEKKPYKIIDTYGKRNKTSR